MTRTGIAHQRAASCDTAIVWTVRTAAAVTAAAWTGLGGTGLPAGTYLITALAATSLVAAAALLVVVPLALTSARALHPRTAAA